METPKVGGTKKNNQPSNSQRKVVCLRWFSSYVKEKKSACDLANIELRWQLFTLRLAWNTADTSWTEGTITTWPVEPNSCRPFHALPRRPLVLFGVCNLYSYVLLQPCYDASPVPPSSNKKNSVVLWRSIIPQEVRFLRFAADYVIRNAA